MILSSIIAFLLLSREVVSVPSSTATRHILFDSIEHIPPLWHLNSSVQDTAILELRIALKHQNVKELEALVNQVSSPDHEDYGNHASREHVLELLRPRDGVTETIVSWLKSSNAQSIKMGENDWIQFTTTVGEANTFLQTDFAAYSKAADSGTILRSKSYSLPEHIAALVDFIHPITHFPRPKPMHESSTFPVRPNKGHHNRAISSRGDVPPRCKTAITPDCLVQMYNIDYLAPAESESPSSLGVAGFLEQYANFDYINDWVNRFKVTPGGNYNFSVVLINNGSNNQKPTWAGFEALLDLDYTMTFTQPMNVTYFSTGGLGFKLGGDGVLLPTNQSDNEPYLEFLEYMLNLEAPPQVISISYTDTEQTVPRAYAERTCTLFAALAARGISTIVAAGDGGVEGSRYEDQKCPTNDGTNRKAFRSTFPASCPYVTAVGSTSLFPEWAESWTAGGFSNYFSRPPWQDKAVAAYKTYLNGTYDGWYNQSGRGVPDVVLYGVRYLTGHGKTNITQKGTSASTPVFASMISLLNDQRMRAGKSSLGWLNPVLYSDELAGAWNDIFRGNNYGCLTSGFKAINGWDAVSGLGTPDFSKLRAILG